MTIFRNRIFHNSFFDIPFLYSFTHIYAPDTLTKNKHICAALTYGSVIMFPMYVISIHARLPTVYPVITIHQNQRL